VESETTMVERLLRRERLIVIGGLVVITGLAWWWVLIGAGTCLIAAGLWVVAQANF
jgi:hypothetical protein